MPKTYICNIKNYTDCNGVVPSPCADLAAVKELAMKTLYPHVRDNYCTLMLLSNLEEPEWIQVKCTKKILSHVVCFYGQDNNAFVSRTLDANYPVLHNQSCQALQIRKNDSCYALQWKHSGHLFHPRVCATPVDLTQINNILFIFGATSASFLPILLPHKLHSAKAHRFCFGKYHRRHRVVSLLKEKGFYVCKMLQTRQKVRDVVFRCQNGEYVSSMHICDGIIDCVNDNSDELSCTCKKTDKLEIRKFFLCKTVESNVSHHGPTCGLLYYKSKKGICLKYSPQQSQTKANGTQMDDKWMENDLVVDNGRYEDEPHLVDFLETGKQYFCPEEFLMPCRPHHSRCFAVEDICKYKLDRKKNLYPCRNGGHIENCGDFECNNQFKCFDSYCIPWSYVCDGKWDCPRGEDELHKTLCENPNICSRMFKCKVVQTCVLLTDVCNQEFDCRFGDDELLCDLSCYLGCFCLAYAMYCQEITLIFGPQTFQQGLIYIQDSIIQDSVALGRYFPGGLFLSVKNNSIRDVCAMELPGCAILLDLSFNDISLTGRHCIKGLSNLSVLCLNSNEIISISPESFANLSSLSLLNISANPFDTLPEDFLTGAHNVKQLYIQSYFLKSISDSAFSDVQIRFVVTNDFHICFVVPLESLCLAQVPWYKHGNNLLPHNFTRFLYIIFGVLNFVVNVLSIVLHFLSTGVSKTFSLVVSALCFNNIFFSGYLGIIWTVDIVFQDVFGVSEVTWRSSTACFSAFFLASFFLINSQILSVFLSLLRYMVVKKPLDTEFKRTDYVLKLLCLFTGISILTCLLMTMIVRFVWGELPYSLCLPSVDPSNNSLLIIITTWLFICSHIVTAVTMNTLHVLLINAAHDSQKILQTSTTKQARSNAPLIVQFVAIGATHTLTWLPANVLCLLIMFLPPNILDLTTWTTVLNTPLYSLVFPVILVSVLLRK